MKKVLKKGKRGNKKERSAAYEEMLNQGNTSSRIEWVQMLIPLGLQAMQSDQKVSIAVPRVRDVLHGKEVPLSSCQGFRIPIIEDALPDR